MFSLQFNFQISVRRQAGSLKSYPLNLPPELRASSGSSLFYDAVSKVQATSDKRAALVKQQVPVRYWRLCFFHLFTW